VEDDKSEDQVGNQTNPLNKLTLKDIDLEAQLIADEPLVHCSINQFATLHPSLIEKAREQQILEFNHLRRHSSFENILTTHDLKFME